MLVIGLGARKRACKCIEALMPWVQFCITFADKSDYDKIQEDDIIDIHGLKTFAPNVPLQMDLHHADGTKDIIVVNHSYNAQQIEWFKAGGALNIIRKEAAMKAAGL